MRNAEIDRNIHGTKRSQEFEKNNSRYIHEQLRSGYTRSGKTYTYMHGMYVVADIILGSSLLKDY